MTVGALALGIDIGTGGVRVAALDGAGVVVATAASAHADHGTNHRSPAIWRAALMTALDRIGTQLDLSRIGAVAVDGTSGTVLGLDADGAPVGDGLMYNDAVDDPAIPARIAEVAPRESAAHGPASALARAHVLQDRPGVRRIVHQADWIAECLSQTPMPSDESNALKTGYDPVARCWPEWLGETRIDRSRLPDVVPAGTVTARTAEGCGLPAGIALVAGVSDGCASFLATGAAEPGDGVTALGTTLTIKLLSDRPVFAPEFGIYSHRIGDIWLAGGASNTGGGVIAAHFDADEVEALSAGIDPMAESGLDYYPLTKPGERFPIADPGLPPRMTPVPDDRGVFLHGVLEGIARIEALGYAQLAKLGAPPIRSLRSVGGGAGNATWSAMRSRITGAPLSEAQATDAAAGVARLALPHIGA